MTPDFDAIIVGAGVVGLAVAREFTRLGHSILVLEAAASAGLETSSRNSEVIHAGIYYPPGSLKAKLCVEGRNQLYAYCAAAGVATRRLGKLIVATSEAEETKLQAIHAQALANGVEDLRWLESREVAAMEPEVHCTRALFSPSTGIIDARGLMLALQGEAESLGASFAFNTRFEAAGRKDGMFHVSARDSGGSAAIVSARLLVNCAGHGAHAAAAAVDGLDPKSLPPRFLARGSYCSVSGKPPFKHLIYPVPVHGALGVHATVDLGGAVRFGPDIEWITDMDYSLSKELAQSCASAVAAYWPAAQDRTFSPTYCGIRPKIHGPDQPAADFCLAGEGAHGVPGLLNLFGIESPGLTSSLAIADQVAKDLGLKPIA